MPSPTTRTKPGSSDELPAERVARAMARGSYKSARDLAKELYKRAPGEDHWRLLFDATIGRAGQLRRAGQRPEAAALLCPLAGRVRSDAERAALAAEMLRAGDWDAASRVQAAVADAAARERIDRARGDAAVLLHAGGFEIPDESCRTGAERVVAALAAAEKGDDARAGALADGAAFPDWSRFVHGLLAFYAGARDVEEWKDLHPQGAPARIAAALLRAARDPRSTSGSADSLAAHLNDSLDAELGEIQRHCDRGNLAAALRGAQSVARRLPPDLRERFVRALYWQVEGSGDPDDAGRLARSVGAPREDPELSRLSALLMERECKRCAQPAWKAYESAVATLPGVPPTSQGLARSLLWLRMAEGADRAERGTSDPWHDEGHLLSRRECCRRAVAAAPDHRAAHDALLDCLKQEGRSDELSTAAAAAVERFPDHEQALCVLADGAHRTGRPLEAVELQERALRCRPHDASMRRALLAYRCALARQMAARGDHAGARALLDEPFLTAACGPDRQAALCLRASIEYLAGDSSAAEEWLERACRTEPGRPSALLSARIEAAALSLSPRIARKLKSSYSVALREPATGAVAVALLRVLAAAPNGLEEEWIRAERKAVLRYMKRASPETFGASELGEACALLEQGGEKRHVRSLAASGQRRYPDDPVFPLVLASYLAANEPDAGSLGRARVLLAQADRLARRSAAHAHLLGAIARLQNRVNDALAVSQLRSIFHIVEGFPFGFETRRPNAPRPAPGSRRRAPARQGRDDRQRSFFDVL